MGCERGDQRGGEWFNNVRGSEYANLELEGFVMFCGCDLFFLLSNGCIVSGFVAVGIIIEESVIAHVYEIREC